MEVYSNLVAFAISDSPIHPYHRLKESQFGEKPYKVRIGDCRRQALMDIDPILASTRQERINDGNLATSFETNLNES